jgi:hypothetical protein
MLFWDARPFFDGNGLIGVDMSETGDEPRLGRAGHASACGRRP